MNLFRCRKVYQILLLSPVFFTLRGQVPFIRPLPENLILEKFYDESGEELLIIVVDGRPPKNLQKFSAPLAAFSTNLSEVPAYDWSFGCSPTSAAMMAAYYDAHGYPDIYTGPTNGGIMPLNNSTWGSAVINGEMIKLCPFSATRDGLDGRTNRGHVDDYWVAIGSTDPDPFITNGWIEHAGGECLGDFMRTSQSTYNDKRNQCSGGWEWRGGCIWLTLGLASCKNP